MCGEQRSHTGLQAVQLSRVARTYTVLHIDHRSLRPCDRSHRRFFSYKHLGVPCYGLYVINAFHNFNQHRHGADDARRSSSVSLSFVTSFWKSWVRAKHHPHHLSQSFRVAAGCSPLSSLSSISAPSNVVCVHVPSCRVPQISLLF